MGLRYRHSDRGGFGRSARVTVTSEIRVVHCLAAIEDAARRAQCLKVGGKLTEVRGTDMGGNQHRFNEA